MSSASAQNQRIHFRLLRVQIVILLSIALVSAIDWQLFPAFRTASIVIAVSLIGLSLLQMFGQIQKYDNKWFASRAVAESVKVQMWRFMMKVSPYEEEDDGSPHAVGHFVADVRQLLNEQQDAKLVAGSQPVEGTEVTAFMLGWRNKEVGERREFYLKGRIRDAKGYRELSQSYGLIAHDLSGYESEAKGADSQEKLEKLVSNVEGRISGEHTYWKARRLY